jgi:hypothetical protein
MCGLNGVKRRGLIGRGNDWNPEDCEILVSSIKDGREFHAGYVIRGEKRRAYQKDRHSCSTEGVLDFRFPVGAWNDLAVVPYRKLLASEIRREVNLQAVEPNVVRVAITYEDIPTQYWLCHEILPTKDGGTVCYF